MPAREASLDANHGTLEHKETYGRASIKLRAKTLPGYDTSNMEKVQVVAVIQSAWRQPSDSDAEAETVAQLRTLVRALRRNPAS